MSGGERMPCSITDGEQYDDQFERREEIDEDEAYENFRQQQIDDNAAELRGYKLLLSNEINTKGEAILLRKILRIIHGKD